MWHNPLPFLSFWLAIVVTASGGGKLLLCNLIAEVACVELNPTHTQRGGKSRNLGGGGYPSQRLCVVPKEEWQNQHHGHQQASCHTKIRHYYYRNIDEFLAYKFSQSHWAHTLDHKEGCYLAKSTTTILSNHYYTHNVDEFLTYKLNEIQYHDNSPSSIKCQPLISYLSSIWS